MRIAVQEAIALTGKPASRRIELALAFL